MRVVHKIEHIGKRIEERWVCSRHPRLSFLGVYTLLFCLLFSGIAAGFALLGRSFVFEARMGDGLRQHYVSLAYYGEYLREVLSNLFLRHTFELPMWDIHIGYGSDILTTLHYYAMGDPLNLLAVFVPVRYTEYLYAFLLVLRMYLAGIAFSAYCRYHKNGRFPTLLGAVLYAFSQWILIAGFRHPFFINPCIYLPLLLLGIDKIFGKERPYLYILMVAVSAMSNFYFFYMLGIFMVIYAVYRYIILFKRLRLGEVLGWLGRFTWSSVIGVLLASVIFLPSLLAVLGTDRITAENHIPTFYRIKYYHMLLPALLGKYQYRYTIIGISAVGVLGLFLLFSKRKRGTGLKVGFLMCMGFLLVPFVGHALNGFSYATNRWSWVVVMLTSYIFVKMYPELFRLSRRRRIAIVGVLGCLTVYIFADAFARHPWNICTAVLLLAVSGVVLLGYGYFGAQRAVTGMVILAGICMGTFVNLYFCFTSAGNPDSGVWKYADAGTAYERNTGPVQAALSELPGIKEHRYEQGGSGILQNASMLTGLNGGQFFFSLANGSVSQFRDEMYSNMPLEQNFQDINGRSYLMKLLSDKYFAGVEAYVPYGYEKIGEVPILREKKQEPAGQEFSEEGDTEERTIEERTIEEGTTEDGNTVEGVTVEGVTEEGATGEVFIEEGDSTEGPGTQEMELYTVGLYEDREALPLAYTYDTYIPRTEYEKMGVMEKQQALLQGVVLEESSLPETTVEDTSLEKPCRIIPLTDCELFDNRIKAKADGAVCVLEFEGVPETEVYVAFDELRYLEVNRRHKYSDKEWKALSFGERREITLKDEKVENQVGIGMEAVMDGQVVTKGIETATNKYNFYNGRHNFMCNMGFAKKAVNRIKLTFPKKGSYQYEDLSIYFQPVDKLHTYAKARKADQVEEITVEGNTASCRVKLDAPRALVFSLPYGKGWSAQVDGQKAELKQANTMFMAVELDEGEHEVRLCYVTPYIEWGLGLSMAGLLSFIGAMVADKKGRKK